MLFYFQGLLKQSAGELKRSLAELDQSGAELTSRLAALQAGLSEEDRLFVERKEVEYKDLLSEQRRTQEELEQAEAVLKEKARTLEELTKQLQDSTTGLAYVIFIKFIYITNPGLL